MARAFSLSTQEAEAGEFKASVCGSTHSKIQDSHSYVGKPSQIKENEKGVRNVCTGDLAVTHIPSENAGRERGGAKHT